MVYRGIPEWVVYPFEIVFSVATALALAICTRLSQQAGTIVFLALILFIVELILLHEFGIFFNAFILLIGLALHAVVEQMLIREEPASAPKAPTEVQNAVS
jgi:hypothetical protein